MVSLVAALAVLLGVAAWIGVRGWLAKGELEQVAAQKSALTEAIAAEDADAMSRAVARVHAHADRAAELTSDPLWHAMEGLPFVGPNAAAVRVTSESLRDVAAAAGPLVAALQGEGAAPGGLDLSLLGGLHAPTAAVAAAVATADQRLAAIDVDALIAPLRHGVGDLRDAVSGAAPVLSDAAAMTGILPAILGADGDRTILVMVQNSAEVRTGGGITGSFIAVQAADGRLSVGVHADSSEFPRATAPVIELPTDLTDLYGAAAGTYVTNATMTADFDLSARLASAWWQKIGYAPPDAVISIDPRVLAAMLRITGPVTLSDGTAVDADHVTTQVLVEPYMEQTQAAQTALQTDLAQRLFEQLLATPLDLAAWAGELSTPISEGRISIWSAHADEQSVLAAGPFAGTLARYRAAGPDAVGVYFNDATTGKMDTYLETEIGVGTRSCRADGVSEVSVSVSVANTATDVARTYPVSMAGGANPALPGDITTDVAVAVPAGWFFGGVDVDGQPAASYDQAAATNPTSLTRVVLSPGQSSTATFQFLTGAGDAAVEPVVIHTPMMSPVTVAPTAALPCG